ncbi:hypothetical protein E2K93_11880 [Thalassotalea sp. HSM 43]|uniref:hypothetical protein n=1 Tax=Thalassotalea sp. HSM 43 TaxID=2552945 RepID=UPI00107FE0FA|nr:hypothetical protein [Thalassotalea sp. HSM 43]QBY05040.1 hypothetical protein E2K93_11875 [Thalassotalea sp. HSM 43]QBY05041.1 hypothetical protein E2K93_11880 [Thalassotalea sp. HSM 43]
MKSLITAFIILLSLPGYTVELCGKYENKIEPDHQWKESDFTKHNAELAIKRLSDSVAGKAKLDWYEYPNLSAYIEGYLLKVKALESNSNHNIRRFCNFIINTAVVD